MRYNALLKIVEMPSQNGASGRENGGLTSCWESGGPGGYSILKRFTNHSLQSNSAKRTVFCYSFRHWESYARHSQNCPDLRLPACIGRGRDAAGRQRLAIRRAGVFNATGTEFSEERAGVRIGHGAQDDHAT